MHQYAVKCSVCSNGALLSHQGKGECLSQRRLPSPFHHFEQLQYKYTPNSQSSNLLEHLKRWRSQFSVPHSPHQAAYTTSQPRQARPNSCAGWVMLIPACWSDGRALINFTCRQATTRHYCRPSRPTHYFTLRRLYLGNFASSLVRFFFKFNIVL